MIKYFTFPIVKTTYIFLDVIPGEREYVHEAGGTQT